MFLLESIHNDKIYKKSKYIKFKNSNRRVYLINLNILNTQKKFNLTLNSESLPREASHNPQGYKNNSVSLLDDSIIDNDVIQATTSQPPNSDVITVTSQSSNSTISNLHDDQVTCITSHR